MRAEIPPRCGVAFELMAGQRLRVIDPRGEQVSDLIAFNRADTQEYLSSGRTLDYASRLFLTTADLLYSNRSRPMFRIGEDRVRRHDFLLTPCSVDTFRILYGHKHPHSRLTASRPTRFRRRVRRLIARRLGFASILWRPPTRPDQYLSFIFDSGGQKLAMAIGKVQQADIAKRRNVVKHLRRIHFRLFVDSFPVHRVRLANPYPNNRSASTLPVRGRSPVLMPELLHLRFEEFEHAVWAGPAGLRTSGHADVAAAGRSAPS